MKTLILTLSLVASLCAESRALTSNVTNWFPQLGCTFNSCQNIGFKERTLPSDRAHEEVSFVKSRARFLEYIETDKCNCVLNFDIYTKKLKSVLYLYPTVYPSHQTSITILIDNYIKAFGKPLVTHKYMEDSYRWTYKGFTISVTLDDVDGFLSIHVYQ